MPAGVKKDLTEAGREQEPNNTMEELKYALRVMGIIGNAENPISVGETMVMQRYIVDKYIWR